MVHGESAWHSCNMCCFVMVAAFLMSAPHTTLNSAPGSARARAESAYANADFVRAAKLLAKAIMDLDAAERGSLVERELRSKLVLSYYKSQQEVAAREAYQNLRERFVDFRLDPERISPSTIAFFEGTPTSRPEPEPASVTAVIIAAPSSAPSADTPRVISTPNKQRAWRWYYLAPFGVGQFLAGSPVRGGIFAVLQTGLLAANIGVSVAYGSAVRAQGAVMVSDDPTRAQALLTAMQVTFFTLMGSLVAGLVDGIFFEP